MKIEFRKYNNNGVVVALLLQETKNKTQFTKAYTRMDGEFNTDYLRTKAVSQRAKPKEYEALLNDLMFLYPAIKIKK